MSRALERIRTRNHFEVTDALETVVGVRTLGAQIINSYVSLMLLLKELLHFCHGVTIK